MSRQRYPCLEQLQYRITRGRTEIWNLLYLFIIFIILYIIEFIVHKMRISHLERFCMVLLSEKLVLLAENECPANKLKSTNRQRDTNYKALDLIDLIKYLTRLFIGSLNQYLYT